MALGLYKNRILIQNPWARIVVAYLFIYLIVVLRKSLIFSHAGEDSKPRINVGKHDIIMYIHKLKGRGGRGEAYVATRRPPRLSVSPVPVLCGGQNDKFHPCHVILVEI